MSAPRVELADWAVQPVRLGEPVLAEMRALYRSDRLPLTQARVALALRGATAAVAGALRRALLESVPHACLAYADIDTSESADAYMIDEFVRTRLAMVPLRMPLPHGVDELRLSLDVENGPAPQGGVVFVHTGDMRVTAGDPQVAAQLFNPVICLATVMPARSLRVPDIRVVRGTGRDDPASFAAVSGVACVPTDLPRRPAADVVGMFAPHAGESDFACDVLTAQARAHRLTFTAEAVPAADPMAGVRALLSLACGSLVERCAALLQAVERGGDAVFAIEALDGDPPGLRVLAVGETHTLMHAVADVLHDLQPDVDFASALVLGEPELVVRSDDPRALLARAVAALRDVFESLRTQVARATARLDAGGADILEQLYDARYADA